MKKTIALLIFASSVAVAEPEVRRAIPVHNNAVMPSEPQVRRAIPVKQEDAKQEMIAAANVVANPTPEETSPAITEHEDAPAELSDGGRVALFFILALALGFITIYCLPGVIASSRKHPNAFFIWVLTLFFGWSFFGWIGTLVWSIMPIERK